MRIKEIKIKNTVGPWKKLKERKMKTKIIMSKETSVDHQ